METQTDRNRHRQTGRRTNSRANRQRRWRKDGQIIIRYNPNSPVTGEKNMETAQIHEPKLTGCNIGEHPS